MKGTALSLLGAFWVLLLVGRADEVRNLASVEGERPASAPGQAVQGGALPDLGLLSGKPAAVAPAGVERRGAPRPELEPRRSAALRWGGGLGEVLARPLVEVAAAAATRP